MFLDGVQLVPWGLRAGMSTIMLQVSSERFLRWKVVSKCDVGILNSFKNWKRRATSWQVTVPIAGAFPRSFSGKEVPRYQCSLQCQLSALGWRTHQA